MNEGRQQDGDWGWISTTLLIRMEWVGLGSV